jgi:hypothetical protein
MHRQSEIRCGDKILSYFSLLKKNQLLGTSYLFIGEDQGLVGDIIKLISCKESVYSCNQCWDCRAIDKQAHPDIFTVEPEGTVVKIEAIREAVRFLALKSFRLRNKIVLIHEGQDLSLEAANAFLKTMEEPPRNSLIAVCVSKIEGVLPTIVSRCRKIFLPFKEKEANDEKLSAIVDLFKGKDIIFKDRKDFSSFLWELMLVLQEDIISKVVSFRNNRLPQNKEYEIILAPYNAEQIYNILKGVLEIYEVYNNINMNLALNLIRLKL